MTLSAEIILVWLSKIDIVTEFIKEDIHKPCGQQWYSKWSKGKLGGQKVQNIGPHSL